MPHGAGVRESFPQIIRSQIRVRIPLEHGQAGEDAERRFHQGQAHQMLPTQEYGALAGAEYPRGFGLDGIENGFRIA